MSQIIAQIVITCDDQGVINVEGTGPLLKQKAYAYGLLELAKDIVRTGNTSRIHTATINDLPH